ncbi:hypothetical protein BT96DRAFT_1017687 [Gymnopus androsaceus JB14]|uniref:Uncharacterized protein n=1 Tax=Gymnopus androsaceus JB14 TaxID=1447944 RepID=A0A6A4HYK7_9AGAR|nr:hypothetical protein BT96DRAFT_1017687 [Gymnopus androsaceus JB14]
MTTNVPPAIPSCHLYTVSSMNCVRSHKKDYAAAVGNFQSRYGGVPSHLPPPTPVVGQKKAKDSTEASVGQSTSSGIGGAAIPPSGIPSPTRRRKEESIGSQEKRLLLPMERFVLSY